MCATKIGVELQLPSAHEWPGTYWYWDLVMTTKLTSEYNLWEAKEQLDAIKAQMEASYLLKAGGGRGGRTGRGGG